MVVGIVEAAGVEPIVAFPARTIWPVSAAPQVLLPLKFSRAP